MNHSIRTARKPFLLLAVMSTLLSMPVNAASVWHSGKVNQVYPTGNGDVVLVFDTDSASCTNGSNPKYYYIRVGVDGVTQDGLENMLAVALTAATTDRTVTINFDDSSTGCFINRLSVNFSQT